MAQSSKSDRLSLEERFFKRKIGPATNIQWSNDDVAVRSGALETGFYRGWNVPVVGSTASAPCHVKQGGSAVTATQSDFYLGGNGEVWFAVETSDEGSPFDGADNYISAVNKASGAAGVLNMTLMSRLTAAN